MQIIPSTANFIAEKVNYNQDIDLFDVECNLYLGIAYVSYLMNIFSSIDIVICAYNAGEGVVREWIESSKDKELVIEYPETERYLQKVKYGMLVYQKKLG